MYADKIGNVVLPTKETIVRYLSEIRGAFRRALRELEIPPDDVIDRFAPFERSSTLGFRFGDVAVRLKDFTH